MFFFFLKGFLILYHCKIKHLKLFNLKYKVLFFFIFSLLSSVQGQINGLELLQGKESQNWNLPLPVALLCLRWDMQVFPLKFVFWYGCTKHHFLTVLQQNWRQSVMIVLSTWSAQIFPAVWAARIARNMPIKPGHLAEVKEMSSFLRKILSTWMK